MPVRSLVLQRLVVMAVLAFAAFGATPAAAGPYTRLQVLVPGESPAPGTTSGRTGTPRAQTVGVPFDITVRACDATWTPVTSVTSAIRIQSTDGSATLPGVAQLVAGQRVFTVTLNSAGGYQFLAHDESDPTIPDGSSSLVYSLPLAGFAFSEMTQKHQYAGVPFPVSVWAIDGRGNMLAGYNGQVRLAQSTSFGPGRISPEIVTLTNGIWTGSVTCYRADESDISRGHVNMIAYLEAAPQKNGTSDPFIVHPGTFSRLQIVVPGQIPVPGSVSGLSGSPTSQGAGAVFTVNVQTTDNWWNPVLGTSAAQITSTDPAFTTVSGSVTNSTNFNLRLFTVGSQTLSVTAGGGIAGMTSPPISVYPSAVHHFNFLPIASPIPVGVPTPVTVQAVDVSNNPVPGFTGDAMLIANTGPGSITPEVISFTNGAWSGNVTFRGAGGSVRLTCNDYAFPPHTGTSNSIAVNPGPVAGLQILLPGESSAGGTADGKMGEPTTQTAGAPFTITVRAVDEYWNHVTGLVDGIALGSDDAFAGMPAETTLVNGQILLPVRLYKSGSTRFWASDMERPIRPDTSSAVAVTGGAFDRLLILAPGESPGPGSAEGRSGTPIDQSINYAFNVTVLAVDQWHNPVGGVSDMVRVTTNDALATVGPDEAMVDGRAEVSVRLASGGWTQITARDVTSPTRPSSTTQVRGISTGFHLEATLSPGTAKAGEPFTLTVKVTNDAGSVITEINSIVTVEAQHATSRDGGRGVLSSTSFQLLGGQRTVAETYTFAEPIVLVVRDDAGNAPGVTMPIDIRPGDPAAIEMSSSPPWVGGNKHATLTARLVDEFDNGIPDRPMTFTLVSGEGTLTPIDSHTNAGGEATADFLSPRQPELGAVRASADGITAELPVQTAFVDPGASGGSVTNYPNPFHPPFQGTTIAYKLDDHATVRIRIFTQSGDLVREESFTRAGMGGLAGLNEWTWDGTNGKGTVVASGGYVALVEAEGTGQTMHVMRRRIAVVR
jgi:hypothetical protein